MSYSYNLSFSYENHLRGEFMDMIKKYGPKELARLTYNDLRDRKNKRKTDINSYEFERSDQIRRRCGFRRVGKF